MRKINNSNCRLKERSDVRPMGSNVSQSVYGDNTVGGSQGYNDMDSHAYLRQAQNDGIGIKRAQNDGLKETGRSMVEMLGVLAIIGVLSIGGIAGYTMAMNRYKANEYLDKVSKLSTMVQAAFATGRKYGFGDTYETANSSFRRACEEVGLKDAPTGPSWYACYSSGRCYFDEHHDGYEITLSFFANGQVVAGTGSHPYSKWDPNLKKGLESMLRFETSYMTSNELELIKGK